MRTHKLIDAVEKHGIKAFRCGPSAEKNASSGTRCPDTDRWGWMARKMDVDRSHPQER